MHSCLYVGQVRHRRAMPARHAFRYPLFMVYLDLAELDRVFRGRWLWSTVRLAPLRFAREDHLGDPRRPLDEAVRDFVARAGGRRPTGPIRLLTQLRHFGYGFNPVSLYYCFDAAGRDLDCIVAEVNNTPWGERHCYLLPIAPDQRGARHLHFANRKEFHVSPFMPMDMHYRWRMTAPGEHLAVHIENHDDDGKVFDATLSLYREQITGASLARTLLRHAFQSLRVIGAIHWQALRLWIKGCPIHDHPARAGNALTAGACGQIDEEKRP